MAKAALYRMSEDNARLFLEGIRWPKGPICPHCKSDRVTALNGAKCRPGLKKCKACRKQFTVTVGTIFERSHIPLADWVYAFARMCASKKGVSAHQLHRELRVQYKTAWFMCHRIREAMRDNVGILSGQVEVDETYVGGKPRYKGQSKRGRGTKKTPVVALVERTGRVHSRVVTNVTGTTLKAAIRENVSSESVILTDDFRAYRGIGKHFVGGHKSTAHTLGEYAKEDGTHTNTVESYFALIKRGVYGTFHHVSSHHLPRYCDEFSFRWNHRMVTDEERTVAAIKQADGKRLTYV